MIRTHQRSQRKRRRNSKRTKSRLWIQMWGLAFSQLQVIRMTLTQQVNSQLRRSNQMTQMN